MSIAASYSPSRNHAGVAIATLAFAALALLLVGPVWLVKLVPTQDGPVHLAQADLIARFGWGGVLQEPAASFYQWNTRIEPNSAIYLLLAGLIRLTGDALLANTLFLTLYGLLWITAAFAVCRAETGRPLLPTLLMLPVAYGAFIHWGFYNFALGMPLFLLFATFWRKVRERGDILTFLTTALFLAALYLTHITSVVAACLLLAADGSARALRTYERNGPGAAGRRLLVDGAWSAAAALPVLVLIGAFLLAYQNIPRDVPGEGGIPQILRRIFAATHLYTFTSWEVAALAPLLGAVLVAGALALRRLRSGDLTWPMFFVLVLLLSLLNLKTGSALLSERLAPYSWMAVVLFIASRQPQEALVRTLCLAAIAGLIGQTAIRTAAYKSWEPTLEAELSIGRANPGKTFINEDLIAQGDSARFALRIRPTLHSAQTAALAARGAALSSPLPSTRYFGYFPLQYTPTHDFLRATADWEAEPNAADLGKFRGANHGAPQVLIVSSTDDSGAAVAHRLGYGDCTASRDRERELVACTISAQPGAAHD